MKANGSVRAAHEKRYLKLLDSLKNDKTFKGDAPLGWKCRNCGYIHEGKQAPAVCPVCRHAQGYFLPYAYAAYKGEGR